MQLILLIMHLVLAVALVIVVLLQRSEGGALGIGGSSGGGMSGFLSGRATANLLTRATAVIATLFIVTSLALAMVGGGGRPGSITDLPEGQNGAQQQQQQNTTGGEQQDNGTTTPEE
jgi:preprotein translocase subunit SecG